LFFLLLALFSADNKTDCRLPALTLCALSLSEGEEAPFYLVAKCVPKGDRDDTMASFQVLMDGAVEAETMVFVRKAKAMGVDITYVGVRVLASVFLCNCV